MSQTIIKLDDPRLKGAGPPLPLNNIQGDILWDGFPKIQELFWFFKITDGKAAALRKQLPFLVDQKLIASVDDQRAERARIQQDRKDPNKPDIIKSSLANIGFSSAGLSKLDRVANSQDLKPVPTPETSGNHFARGMEAEIDELGDPQWTSAPFLGRKIDGVVLIGADDLIEANRKLSQIKTVLGDTVSTVTSEEGNGRKPPHKAHEHFGFLDGVTEPAVRALQTIAKTNEKVWVPIDVVDPKIEQEWQAAGNFLIGRNNDETNVSPGPAWALDGSFLTFRRLKQNVAAFEKFVTENSVGSDKVGKEDKDLSAQDVVKRDLFGARLTGRWKSGCPLIPDFASDDPNRGIDPSKPLKVDPRIPFKFGKDGKVCPFAAHVRKVNPRDGFADGHRILRRGIQFGNELSPAERAAGSDTQDRGLMFACYQSSISNGFHFNQTSWANNPSFPFGSTGTPGLDPLIGSGGKNGSSIKMLDVSGPGGPIAFQGFNRFVRAQGGEYFFMPSLSALKSHLGAPGGINTGGGTNPGGNTNTGGNTKDGGSATGGGSTPSAPPVAIAIENRQAQGGQPGQVNKDIPVNGQSSRFAAILNQAVVLATNLWVQKPATAQGVQLGVAAPDGRTFSIRGDGTPLDVSTGGKATDVAQWTIKASKG